MSRLSTSPGNWWSPARRNSAKSVLVKHDSRRHRIVACLAGSAGRSHGASRLRDQSQDESSCHGEEEQGEHDHADDCGDAGGRESPGGSGFRVGTAIGCVTHGVRFLRVDFRIRACRRACRNDNGYPGRNEKHLCSDIDSITSDVI